MSIEAVLEFWQNAQVDDALQGKVAAAVEGKDHDAGLEGIMAVASDAGYEFTEDDYEAARQELPKLVLAGDDAEEGEVSAFAYQSGKQLVAANGALRPGGILRRGGILNGRLGSTSALYTNYRGY